MAAPRSPVVEYLLSEFAADTGDVTLILGEGDVQETLRAHGVLLRRAEYFQSALRGPFREGQTRRVELPDVSPDAMRVLVTALYSDSFSADASSLSLQRLFELCRLAERLLVPDSIVDLAYGLYAKAVVESSASCQEYVDVFAQLSGARVAEKAMDALLAGFQTAAEESQWTTDALLSLVVEASSKKVDVRARDILKAMLARTVVLGGNLATTAVQAARRGVVDASEAIFSNLPRLMQRRADPIRDLDRERTTLHSEISSLPSHLHLQLKLLYAVKALQSLPGRLPELQPSPESGDECSAMESKLVRDIEVASAQLFAKRQRATDERRSAPGEGPGGSCGGPPRRLCWRGGGWRCAERLPTL